MYDFFLGRQYFVFSPVVGKTTFAREVVRMIVNYLVGRTFRLKIHRVTKNHRVFRTCIVNSHEIIKRACKPNWKSCIQKLGHPFSVPWQEWEFKKLEIQSCGSQKEVIDMSPTIKFVVNFFVCEYRTRVTTVRELSNVWTVGLCKPQLG